MGSNREHLVKIVLRMTLEGVKQHKLNDSFMWDISDPDNSPEDFAAQLVNDLNLPFVY